MHLLSIAKSTSAKELATAASIGMPSESAPIIGDVILGRGTSPSGVYALPTLTVVVANLMQ
jgi:hypothetical protein